MGQGCSGIQDCGAVASTAVAEALLAARAQQSAACAVSTDLGLSMETAALQPDGVVFSGRPHRCQWPPMAPRGPLWPLGPAPRAAAPPVGGPGEGAGAARYALSAFFCDQTFENPQPCNLLRMASSLFKKHLDVGLAFPLKENITKLQHLLPLVMIFFWYFGFECAAGIHFFVSLS